jgi:hypothetical protein
MDCRITFTCLPTCPTTRCMLHDVLCLVGILLHVHRSVRVDRVTMRTHSLAQLQGKQVVNMHAKCQMHDCLAVPVQQMPGCPDSGLNKPDHLLPGKPTFYLLLAHSAGVHVQSTLKCPHRLSWCNVRAPDFGPPNPQNCTHGNCPVSPRFLSGTFC